MTETGSGKFFVKQNGDSVLKQKGRLNDREIGRIQKFIKQNYRDMYRVWSQYSDEGFDEQ
ncbi:MAG: hypothetical protein IJH61_09255 [Eubacteriaceae bacterium]|nr:hypothetical protein [Eubacteriaceae bacterium]